MTGCVMCGVGPEDECLDTCLSRNAMSVLDDQRDWLLWGVNKGWISDVVCGMHDGIPMSPEENEAFEDGYDPCTPVVRVWET